MAEFHFRAKVTGRKDGRSAVASAAYRAAELLRLGGDQGEVFDYSRRRGVEAAFILTPDISPRSAKRKPLRLALDHLRTDRQALWQMVEDCEKRKDAQLFRELEISLPLELAPEQRRALIEGFVREHLTSAGMIADVAIHTGDAGGKAQQPHAHVMLTMRSLNADGTFGKKARDWNEHGLVEVWRKAWADATNEALEAAGHAVRVDHRSLEARRKEILALIENEPDEVARLRLQGQAAALDYIPQPELSPTEWRAMESGDWPEAFAPKIEAFKAAAESKRAAAELSAAYAAAADELEQERAEAEAQRIADEAAAARRAEEQREQDQRDQAERARQQAEILARAEVLREERRQREAEEAAKEAQEKAQRAAQSAKEAQEAREREKAAQDAQRAAQEAQEAKEAQKVADFVGEVAHSLGESRLLPVALDRAVTNFKMLQGAKSSEREDWTAKTIAAPHGAGFLKRLSVLKAVPVRLGKRKRAEDTREEVALEDIRQPSFVQSMARHVTNFIREIAMGAFNDSEGRKGREDTALRKVAWAEAGAFHDKAPEMRARSEIMAEQSPQTDQAQPSLGQTPPKLPRGGGLSM
ncbi:MobQ family relaxase [Ochrobactrum teleogrylli]|uniref:MobQ family relaxase n=1 Tax=Ochrobactrum teleogrylli TaxID=2479765 RepID=UPI00384EE969